MIVKMSKYAFMVYHREYDAFLTTLRELGVVHVKETNSVLDNAELQALLAASWKKCKKSRPSYRQRKFRWKRISLIWISGESSAMQISGG